MAPVSYVFLKAQTDSYATFCVNQGVSVFIGHGARFATKFQPAAT